ncbi:hypothetical protein ACWGJQ_13240 [Peribacillus simplex]
MNKNKEDNYKTVRINPKEYRFLKDWAYFLVTPVFSLIFFHLYFFTDSFSLSKRIISLELLN